MHAITSERARAFGNILIDKALPPEKLGISLLAKESGTKQTICMSDRDTVIEMLRQMPEAATLDQISEEIAILAAIRKGEKAADAGQVVPHAEVRQRLGLTRPKISL